jgi:hypothetical protein
VRVGASDAPMKRFVFWTGLLSLAAGTGFQFSAVAAWVLHPEPAGLAGQLFGAMAMFVGIMLMLCSRDLPRYGTLVLWESLLRVGGFVILGGHGWHQGNGFLLAMGVGDLAIGVVYLVGLPRHLGVAFIDLLLDRACRK